MFKALTGNQKKLHRSRLDELGKKMDQVEYILTHFPESQKNANLLCCLFWVLVERANSLDDVIGLTKTENIARMKNIIVKRWKENKT